MATDEVEFLRDQVQRLNEVLAEYQEKYPPVVQKLRDADSEPAPWTTDKQLLAPLLVEYDSNVKELQIRNSTLEQEHKGLRNQVDKLVAENIRLNRQLKENIQSQLEGVDVGDLQPTVEDDHLLHSLQQQLQLAVQEKDAAMEMWQASTQEVERLESQLQSQALNPHVQALAQNTEELKHQYTRSINELNNQILELQDKLRQSQNENKASAIQVTELRRTLEEMKNQLLRKEQERTTVSDQSRAVGSKAEELALKTSDMQAKLEDKENELYKLQGDKKDLERQIIELTKRASEIEQREYEAVIQVKESVQMVENAMLEKDQALVREQQALDQVNKLQEAISKLVDDAGARTRQEVDSVKKQCNQNIAKLMEEIHGLELENSEKQAQIDRAVREKRAVESELEKLYQEGLVQGSKEAMAYEDLNRRACNAERARDEAILKLDSTIANLKRLESTAREEKRQMETELSSLKERFDTMSAEFENINDNRVKLLEEIDNLKRSMHNIRQERDSMQRNCAKQIACMEHDVKMKSQDYEVKLQSLEDSHRHAMLEIRQLLTAQQRMSAKWKEECQTITQKFEAKVRDLQSEVTRHKKRSDELTKLLRDSREKVAQTEEMLVEYSRNIKRMEDRIREAENRANLTSAQVSKQLSRTRNLMHSTQHSQALSSSIKSSGGADPLALSDLAVNGSIHRPSVTFSGSTQGGTEDPATR